MPLYDITCHYCRQCFEDVLLTLEEYEHPPCPACGREARILLNAGMVNGPTDTKPVYMEAIDQTFTSARQVAEYEKRTGTAFLSHGDSTWIAQKDRSRERVESSSKRLGFRDWEHRKAYLRGGGHASDPNPD